MMKQRKLLISILTGLCACLMSATLFAACGGEEHIHIYTKQVTTEATCTEKGIITYTCSCNDTYTEEISALGHDEKTHQAQAPTCTEIGWEEYVTCEREGCEYSTREEIPVLGHDEITYPEISATCQNTGLTAYTVCQREGCSYRTEQTEIPIQDHYFKYYISDGNATCQKDGTKTSHCEYGCGTTDVAAQEKGTHNPVYWSKYDEKTGYYKVEISCLDCEAMLLTTGYYAKTSSDSIGNKEKWSSNALLNCIPYPDGASVNTLYLDNINTPNVGIYGYAGGIFTASEEVISKYLSKVAYCEYSYYAVKTEASFTGYSYDRSRQLTVGFVGNQLTILVNKLVDKTLVNTDASDKATRGWPNNSLLVFAPYPYNGTEVDFELNTVNKAQGSFGGWASGTFEISLDGAQTYFDELEDTEYLCYTKRTDNSFIGYNFDKTRQLKAEYKNGMLTVTVYKMNRDHVSIYFSDKSTEHVCVFSTYIMQPTCNQLGLIIRYCACGSDWGEAIPMREHRDTEAVSGYEPTCKSTGLTDGVYCNDCGGYPAPQKEIPALGHIDVDGWCTRCEQYIEYTITFMVDGEVYATRTYTIHTMDDVTPPVVPEKKGYNGVWVGYEVNRKDITVEAEYTVAKYKINYVLDGGKNHKDNPTEYTYGDLFAFGEPTNGKLIIFGGWFTDKSFTADSAIAGITPDMSGDITVYAQWISYRVEKAEGFEIDYDGLLPTLYTRVSNTTERFDFKSKITVSKNCTWKVYADEYSSTPYDMKVVPLSEGENIYYIVVYHPDGEYYTQYMVSVHRRRIFNVMFDTQQGSVVEGQTLEEDSLITKPETSRVGYTFKEWDYDFNTPISGNITITAIWTPNEDTKYTVRYYTENLDNSEYSLYQEISLYGTTDTTATAEVKEIKHFTYNEDKSANTVSGNINPDGSGILSVYYTRNVYTVSLYDCHSDTTTHKGSYKYGKEITLMSTVNLGYEFLGWYYGEECISLETTSTFTITDNVIGKINVKEEMQNFTFSSTSITCQIKGVKDETVTKIVVPDYVTQISNKAFSGCGALTEITLPFIGETKDGTSHTNFGYIFGTSYYDENEDYVPFSLKKVTITGGIISNYAFYNCDSLKIVVIGDSITSIGNYAFRGCSSLTSVEIPNSVTSIGEYAFSECDLTSVVIGDGVTSIAPYVFYNCDSLTSIEIPDSVTSIGKMAFSGCSSLISVVIGEGVTSIVSEAFYNCSRLTSVYITDIVAWCNISFGNINANPLYYATNLYLNNELITELVIPDSVTSIGNHAFYGYNVLTSVKIGNGVTSIGEYAFAFCDGLTSVIIPDNVTSIGKSAFEYCVNLTNMVIGNSVRRIYDYAFSRCYKLIDVCNKSSLNISIGSSYNGNIGDYAKNIYTPSSGGSKLSNDNGYIVYTEGEERILVGYNGTETDLVLPSYITQIYQYAFYGFDSLTSVVIGDGVTSIGNYAFYGCDSLPSITIPDSVTGIGNYAFYNCDSLTSVIFKETSTWYRTPQLLYFTNKTKGTQTDVTISSCNATYFKSTYINYYWYKL